MQPSVGDVPDYLRDVYQIVASSGFWIAAISVTFTALLVSLFLWIRSTAQARTLQKEFLKDYMRGLPNRSPLPFTSQDLENMSCDELRNHVKAIYQNFDFLSDQFNLLGQDLVANVARAFSARRRGLQLVAIALTVLAALASAVQIGIWLNILPAAATIG